MKTIKDNISIVLCGEAGQGIQTVENILVKLLKLSNYNVFAAKEYMSRVRGGVNSTSIRISSGKVRAYAEHIDIMFALSKDYTKHLKKRISPETQIISDIGNNISAVGVIAQIMGIDHALANNV